MKSAHEKVEQEISEGKLGIARDRLQGLVRSYPLDFALRSRLGDVYSMLGYPRDAGKWWFLDEELTEEKNEAIDEFIRWCRNDPQIILRQLKLGFHPEELPSAVRQRILDQIDECVRRGLEPPKIPEKEHPPIGRFWGHVLMWGCLLVVIAILFLAFIGFQSLIHAK